MGGTGGRAGFAARKRLCWPGSAWTTTPAWSAATSKEPRRACCTHWPVGCSSTRPSVRTCSTWRAANPSGSKPRRPASQKVRPGVQRVLDAITGAPAWVRNGRADVLAVNRLGYALYSPVFDGPVRPANTARFTFLDPRAPEFHRTGVKQLHHPVVGDLDLTYEALELPSEPGLTLIVYTAEAGTPTHDALELLASWAATLDRPERADLPYARGQHHRRSQLNLQPKPPTTKAPAETFTGDAWYDVLAAGDEPSRILGRSRISLPTRSTAATEAHAHHGVGWFGQRRVGHVLHEHVAGCCRPCSPRAGTAGSGVPPAWTAVRMRSAPSIGRHTERTDLGREFGATDVIAERGAEGVERVR